MPSFFRSARIVFLLLLALALGAPSQASAKKAAAPEPEPEPQAMVLANRGHQDLVAIRILSGEAAGFARTDLAPGDEDEIENPGGVAEIRMDLGLSLARWTKVNLAGVRGLALCGEHENCLIVQDEGGAERHLQGTAESLLPGKDAVPACSLEGFRTGMTMKDACGLLKKYDVMEEDTFLAPMGFANIVWSARLYANRENAASLGDAVLESVELRQKLDEDNIRAVLKTVERQKYVAWQAAFPGMELTFTEMQNYSADDCEEILELCLSAFLKSGRGSATIQFVPASLMQALSSLELPRGDTQIYSLILHEDSSTMTLDMTAYSFEELQLQ
ncbi:MAG: hypothetical protein Q4F72_09345 [Desulfovibrionaceae bacterium]|nr:hypothetical protein [Desulfovibrionaceae bacterium]